MPETIFIITGAPRSGITLLSQCLQTMRFVELKRQNSFDAATINALLFQDMGLNPLMPTPLPVDWLLTDTAAEAKDRIKNLLADARLTDQCYYMADPLFCHTLPLWLEVFKEKSLAVTCIYILRHPWEVAQSLAGFENLDLFKAHTLWLSFSLTLLKQFQCQTIVTFNQLLADPVSTLKRLINTVTFQENKQYHANLKLLDLVQPALKRNHAASFPEAAQKTFRPFERLYQQFLVNYLKTPKQENLFQQDVTGGVFSDIMSIFLNAYGRQEKQTFNKLLIQGQKTANQMGTDLYARVISPEFQENISSAARLPLFIDEWQKIVFPLSELVLSLEKSFFFSPLNSNGVVKISNINLLNKITGASVWAAKTIEDFNRLNIRGNAVRLPDKENLILLITGPEPEIHLPLLTHISSCPVDLEVWLKVTKKQDIVRDKVSLSLLANDQMRRDEGAGPFLKLPKGLSVPDDEEAVVDYILENSSKFLPADKFPIFLALAQHHIKQKNNLRALHYLGQARNSIPERPENLLSLANLYLDINRIEEALELYVALFLKEWFVDETLGKRLIQQFNQMYSKARKTFEHGQQILMDYIRNNIEYLKSKADHKLTLIEIGSTREDVPGQGSTRKLASFCKTHGIHFITVDMDPQNTKKAAETLSKIDAGFKAVNQKGEDFLRDYTGPMDFVFLDAYDFDHGKHSKERQIRYEKYLGNRISDQACHRMHLECAEQVQKKMSVFGAVCLDDTWFEDGAWQAKGTLAVPYLLTKNYCITLTGMKAVLITADKTSLSEKIQNSLKIHLEYNKKEDTNALISLIDSAITGRVCVTEYLHGLYLLKKFMGHDCRVYVETGSLFGGSLCLAMQDPTPCTFIGIDLFDGYYGKEKDPKTKMPINLETVRQNIDRLNVHKHHYKLIQGSSYDGQTVAQFKDLKLWIDLLFIDGDHSREGVINDYDAYKDFMNPGGFIVFDNYGEPNVWEEVKKAVDTIDFKADRFEKIGQYGFSYIVRKK